MAVRASRAIATLILDTTKTVGFMALTQLEFNLTTIAAILTIIGFSVNDKVVVFDRMRENLRKYKPCRCAQLVDLCINETLNRTLGTSMTLLLSALPLALFGGRHAVGLRLGDDVRHRHRHLLLDLHRRADRAADRREQAAPRRGEPAHPRQVPGAAGV